MSMIAFARQEVSCANPIPKSCFQTPSLRVVLDTYTGRHGFLGAVAQHPRRRCRHALDHTKRQSIGVPTGRVAVHPHCKWHQPFATNVRTPTAVRWQARERHRHDCSGGGDAQPHTRLSPFFRPPFSKPLPDRFLVAVRTVAQAPPPPPGATTRHYYDPMVHPPPPPSLKARALELYTIHEIKPRTRALCSGGLEGLEHQTMCLEMSSILSKWQPVYAAGVIAPFCHRVCWHTCAADDYGQGRDDGFASCPSESCAKEDCLEFLKNTCPPKLHTQIESDYASACTIVPPSPPQPPHSPPSPPLFPPPPLPQLPPPFVAYSERSKLFETDSDPDCEMLSYGDCREVVRQYAQANPGYLDSMDVTFAPCEGLSDETDCFLGCSFGSPLGGRYHFLLPTMEAEFGDYNYKRCKTAEFPLCACANLSPPPPGRLAPPPPLTFADDFHPMTELEIGQTPNGGAQVPHAPERGRISVLSKRMVNARTIDLALRSSFRDVECPGEDDGEATCTRYCAEEHLGNLRAVTVTGVARSSSPAPPPPPSPPPPPPPLPPRLPFNACSNTCEGISVDETRCRDGGSGGFFPALCAFGTQCKLCGFRTPETSFVADDSCTTANNGLCEDGGYDSFFTQVDFTLDSTIVNHLCAYGTDASDCGAGTRDNPSLDAFVFSGETNLSMPLPPAPSPPPPASPPPRPPPFDGCSEDLCHSYFALSLDEHNNTQYEFVCSGTDFQLTEKVARGLCDQNKIGAAVDVCSDGGYGARSLFWSGQTFTGSKNQGRFGCDYGSQCAERTDARGRGACGQPRPRDEFVNPACTTDSTNADGTCTDSCFVDLHMKKTYDFDPATIGDASLVDDGLCHDGGVGSVDSKCVYGSQVFVMFTSNHTCTHTHTCLVHTPHTFLQLAVLASFGPILNVDDLPTFAWQIRLGNVSKLVHLIVGTRRSFACVFLVCALGDALLRYASRLGRNFHTLVPDPNMMQTNLTPFNCSQRLCFANCSVGRLLCGRSPPQVLKAIVITFLVQVIGSVGQGWSWKTKCFQDQMSHLTMSTINHRRCIPIFFQDWKVLATLHIINSTHGRYGNRRCHRLPHFSWKVRIVFKNPLHSRNWTSFPNRINSNSETFYSNLHIHAVHGTTFGVYE